MTAKVFIKPRRAKPFWFGDPWVFEGSIDRVKGKGRLDDGDVVEVHDHDGHLIGRGFYNSKSRIAIRLATLGDVALDDDWIRAALGRAVALRKGVLRVDAIANVYRLVHAEGDGLPGLVVDRVGDWLVMHCDALGMRRFRDVVAAELERLVGPRGIYERVSRTAREQEGIVADDGLVRGEVPAGAIDVVENDLKYKVDILAGQKSGFYSDQRDNRRALARFARGRRVLDCFSYTGAFGLNLLRHGDALGVTAVDSSAPALEALEVNAGLNGLSEFVQVVQGNVLRYLDHLRKEAAPLFDLVVVDPPKLVPKMADLRRGLKLYHEINVKGMEALASGGIFATSSCSGLVSEDAFEDMLIHAAQEAGVRIQCVLRGGQGPDHPVLLPHAESRYLKFHVYVVYRADS